MLCKHGRNTVPATCGYQGCNIIVYRRGSRCIGHRGKHA